jgi:hypothetical protein
LQRRFVKRGQEAVAQLAVQEHKETHMATNLVAYIMQFITPDMISRIAAALGLSRNDAQAGVSAAVPTLLAAISGAAVKPGGAQSLVDAIKQQSGVLESTPRMVGGGNQPSFIEKGSSQLTALLGSHDQSALVGAVGKFAGLQQDESRSLLGMLTPIVMGLIGKQIGPRLDVSSLTALLASQRDQIAQALPAGMSKLLSGTGLLDSLAGAAGSAAEEVGQAGRMATATTGQIGQFASSAGRWVEGSGQRAAGVASPGIPAWVYWAIPLAVIAGILWYLLGDRAEQFAQRPPTVATQSVMVGGVDIGKQVGDSLGDLRTSLQGITDAASANAALPKLQANAAQIDKVNSVVGQLSDDQRRFVGGLVTPPMIAINQLFDKVLAIPGAGEVVKPTIDNLKTKLADLSWQSTTVGGPAPR